LGDNQIDKLDALRAFVAAAEARSFAAAGRQLRRTRDAVSKAIAYLEAEVGTPLFLRTTRRLELTDAGFLLPGARAARRAGAGIS
jgi:DNA-binding transcriptional LysR family regulator